MNFLKRTSIYLLLIVILAFQATNATNLTQSSQNEIFDNPFVVIGLNPNTKILTGYVAALRTAPGI
ncbi:MAG: hypothetical protein C0512_15160 [Flavobacterium sp.]|nr:hypothetical protein [Flavobacterium sp.]